jgi:hypothetical protein
MTLRALVALLIVLLPIASAECQGDRKAADLTKPFTLEQVWAFDATYVDKQHGVRFRYPSVWKPETQFAYFPPTLTQSDKPIAGFAYSEGGFPRDRIVGPYSASNLEGFGIVYAAHPVADESACETIASSMTETSKHRSYVFGGRTFSERDTGGAGMSQSISGKLYASYVRPTCYLFETDVAVSSGAMPDVQGLTAEQLALIEKNLERIMASVRIAPR